ncbi:MAG: metal-dependent transcriptional regulator, partial [Anaerolineaceae bacterium]
MKSESVEDYLKAIYLIQERQEGAWASTSSIAAHLGIADASVTGMFKRFAAADPPLAVYEKYGGVKLTQAGEKVALEVIRHHRLVECYLHEMLGYSWDEVHEEAERLEHVISDEMEERLAQALGHPSVDPHGDPIPDRDGAYRQPDYQPLSAVPAGQMVQIRRVTGQQPDLLRYLSGLGLVLLAQVEVVSVAPFTGPVTVRLLDENQTVQALGREVAEQLLVMPVSAPSLQRGDT